MTITLLSKESCIQCAATERTLDAEKVNYTTENIYDNLDLVQSLGYMAAPVVVVRDTEGNIQDHWAGFNRDKISELASVLKAA